MAYSRRRRTNIWREPTSPVALSLQKAEHELARFRAVFFPRPAYGPRGVAGYHLRNLQTQAETASNPDEGHAAAGRAQREWPPVKANDRGRRSCAAGLSAGPPRQSGEQDLSPKELARREREHFGIFGGVRPVSRRR